MLKNVIVTLLAALALSVQAQSWAWDDGTTDTILPTGGFARMASHTYAAPGVYSVGVTVTDDDILHISDGESIYEQQS